MNTHRAWLATFSFAAALGCAGKHLNDVGDLNTGGAGEGGAGEGSGATGAATGTGGGGGSGSGAGGGTGGTTGGGGGGGTDTVAPDIGPCNVGDGCVFEEGTGIRALAADATRLYWVEYGTSDELGNYANDGRLLSRAFDSSEVTTLATDLAGPLGLAVTSTHAYAYVDQVWHDGGLRIALVRVPLAGGEPQTVHVDFSPRGRYGKCGTSGKCFYTYDDAGYWSLVDGTYEITAASDESVRISDEPLELVGVDEWHLYYVTEQAGPNQAIDLLRIPRSGGDAELVTNDAKNARRALSGDYVYALQGTLLRMPKEGGNWTALAQLSAMASYEFSIAGDSFFFDGQPGDSVEWRLRQGSLSNPETADVIVHLPSLPQSWVGTPSGAYWTDGGAIYFRDLK